MPVSELRAQVGKIAGTVIDAHNLYTVTDLTPIGLPVQIGPRGKRVLLAGEGLVGAGLACLGTNSAPTGVTFAEAQATANSAILTATGVTPTPGDLSAQPDLLGEAEKQVASGLTGRNSNPDVQVQVTGTPNALTPKVPPATPSNIPTGTPEEPSITPSATSTEAPTATVTPIPDIVELDSSCTSIGENAPKTPLEAIAKVGGKFQDWQAVRHVDSETGKWNGGWDFEGYNAIDTTSVQWDAIRGVHIDIRQTVDGNPNPNFNKPTFDHGVIFDESQGMTNVDVTLTDADGWMFARRGGEAPTGFERNVSHFVGTVGVTVEKVEQAAFTPFCEVCLPNSPVTPAETKAYQSAVQEFTWNNDAKTGKITVKVYYPTEQKMEIVDGKMIAELSDNNMDMSFIDQMSFGWMLHPQQIVDIEAKSGITTKAEWWQPVVENGKWTGGFVMEAFPHLSTVEFDSTTGLFHNKATGKLVTAPDEICDFSRWADAKNSWPMRLASPHADAMFFARTGGGANDQPNTSWFTGGKAGVIVAVKDHGLEQAGVIPACIVPGSGETISGLSLIDAQSNLGGADVSTLWWFDQSQNGGSGAWTEVK